MNTTLLKRFATEARNILLKGVANRLEGLGFDLETGQPSEKPQLLEGGAIFRGGIVSTQFYDRWMSLYHSIEHNGIRDVAEEAAYTWFNRLIAIRILSKQGIISPVLQYESEDIRIPLIVSEARHGRMPEMPERLQNELNDLLNDDSKTNEQFALLIVAFCHSNPIINKCFGAISDYTELLLPQDILREGGFVDMLNHTPFISDEDYGSSTLIGWLYQFYISDRKDEVFAKKGKYDADEIAPATQIFTPAWIVEYMVQNTIGRIYLDNYPDAADEFEPKWKYLVDQAQRDSDHICQFNNLEDLRFADLGCGSGHIVGYMFEVLFQLYKYEGYSRREAVEHILKENLTGVDIDKRAKQLATFALLLKACQKDESFADAKVMPNILDMPDPFTEDKTNEDSIIREQFSHFILGNDKTVLDEIVDAVKLMDDAKTLGSIMKFNISERTRNILKVRLDDYEQQEIIPENIKKMIPYVKVILALTEDYTALVMNPPYMGSGRFDKVLSDYVKSNYAKGKADLFSVFMLMAQDRLAPNGKYAMINMQSWMFLSSFQALREDLLRTMQIDSLLHLGPHTFDELGGEVVQNVAFVVSNNDTNTKGTYLRLVEGKDCKHKEDIFLNAIHGEHSNNSKVFFPFVNQNNFQLIPGCPIGYWVSDNVIDLFSGNNVANYGDARSGMSTTDNLRFLRLWFETSKKDIYWGCKSLKEAKLSGLKWFPYNKGGEARKWYGNNDYIVNYQNDGEEIKFWVTHNPKDPKTTSWSRRIFATDCFFKSGLTWTSVSTKYFNCRFYPDGFIFDSGANGLFAFDPSNVFVLLSLLNSKVANAFLELLNPTINYGPGTVGKIPVKIPPTKDIIQELSKENVHITKKDWDSHETSWDFSENPLVAIMKSASTGENVSNGQTVSNQRLNGSQKISNQAAKDTQLEAKRVPFGSQKIPNCNDSDNQQVTKTDLEESCKNISYGDEATKFIDEYNEDIDALKELCNPSDGVQRHNGTLKTAVKAFETLWTARFMQLHANEEELNRQFIDIYGLQDELTPDVPLDEVTILQQGEIDIKDGQIAWNEKVIIEQLISYAVGVCMGRYRLDKAGLHIAYPNPSDDDLAPYTFNGEEIKIDDDGIIPLLPRECPFNDNMQARLVDFVRIVFGEDFLSDNLNYIEKSLGKPIEQYLQKDFCKYHKKMYQNRPIYWMFSSKKGAFQCIAYMHRMTPYTAEQVRTKYLLPYIEYLVNKQKDMQANDANLTAQERRELDKIDKQIDECREYHDRLHEVSDQQIAFDLDDGVVVNYAKFGNVLAKIK